MKLLDRYFTEQIDRALDEGLPLHGWTAWYVRKNSELRQYYEAMLEMELELRFPFFEDFSAEIKPVAARHFVEKKRAITPLFIGTALAVLLLLASVPFLFRPQEPAVKVVVQKDERIDLAELLDMAAPLAEIVPAPKNPLSGAKFADWSDPESLLPVEPIVRFTEQPLDSMLSLLETAQIVRGRPVPQ